MNWRLSEALPWRGQFTPREKEERHRGSGESEVSTNTHTEASPIYVRYFTCVFVLRAEPLFHSLRAWVNLLAIKAALCSLAFHVWKLHHPYWDPLI